jgi:hypothetical protein
VIGIIGDRWRSGADVGQNVGGDLRHMAGTNVGLFVSNHHMFCWWIAKYQHTLATRKRGGQTVQRELVAGAYEAVMGYRVMFGEVVG